MSIKQDVSWNVDFKTWKKWPIGWPFIGHHKDKYVPVTITPHEAIDEKLHKIARATAKMDVIAKMGLFMGALLGAGALIGIVPTIYPAVAVSYAIGWFLFLRWKNNRWLDQLKRLVPSGATVRFRQTRSYYVDPKWEQSR